MATYGDKINKLTNEYKTMMKTMEKHPIEGITSTPKEMAINAIRMDMFVLEQVLKNIEAE